MPLLNALEFTRDHLIVGYHASEQEQELRLDFKLKKRAKRPNAHGALMGECWAIRKGLAGSNLFDPCAGQAEAPVMSPFPKDPIATDADGRATCCPALGAWFHMEKLLPSDAPRLEEACARILEWLGGQLRFTFSSFDPEVLPFRPQTLDYISGYAAALPDGTSPFDAITANFSSFARADFSVHCIGSDDAGAASPVSVRFFAEIPEFERRPIEVNAVLGITVPCDWPLDDFESHVLDFAKALRLRWATAGLTYSRWTVAGVTEVENAIAAHARRYVGFDMGIFVRQTKALYDHLRTVSWLTLLGPGLMNRVALPVSDGLLLSTAGDVRIIKAGATPEAGDVNRLAVPPLYVAADKLLRPLRAARLNANAAPGDWDDQSLSRWLRRFELSYS